MVFSFCLFEIHKTCEKQTDSGFVQEAPALSRFPDGHCDAKQPKVLAFLLNFKFQKVPQELFHTNNELSLWDKNAYFGGHILKPPFGLFWLESIENYQTHGDYSNNTISLCHTLLASGKKRTSRDEKQVKVILPLVLDIVICSRNHIFSHLIFLFAISSEVYHIRQGLQRNWFDSWKWEKRRN